MGDITPELIDKLFAYPALVGVGCIMWIHYKLMTQMLNIIKENRKGKVDD